MSSDPLLKAAIAHWGPRFVANGVVLTDFEEVTGSISSYNDWCSAWSARAGHHEKLGRDALAKKHSLTPENVCNVPASTITSLPSSSSMTRRR
jgi:2,6-dihydroxypseudooxynicotine hydrolase